LPGNVTDTLKVYRVGQTDPAIQVPIRIEATSYLRLYPSILSLPRTVEGKPSYNGRVLCRAVDGKPVKLTFSTVPEGVTIHHVPDEGVTQVIAVEVDPRVLKSREVSLGVGADGRTEPGTSRLRIILD
jgi:hypothetical protein